MRKKKKVAPPPEEPDPEKKKIVFMAECSSSSGDGSWFTSPISNIAQDHLYSILLLLPVDSILSVAMTCKRFRSIACSDSLWESVCRRDWGQVSVDYIKSCGDEGRVPWMKLYRQVYDMGSVSCHRLFDTDGGKGFPGPRASHSFNFVSGCLVLFGGGCEGGRHLDDTWVAYMGKDLKRKPKWQKISTTVNPTGRFGHSCVVVGNSIVLFGGINDRGIRQSDTWIAQITSHETQAITLSWRLLQVNSTMPPPRGAHAACCIDGKKMLIHGGIGLSGLRIGDTWILDLSENHQFGTWNEIVSHPSPPARSGHTLTCIDGKRTVLFGGRGLGYEVLNDVWFFDSFEDQKWLQLQFDLGNVPGRLSLPRVGHSAALILGGKILIYGGEDSYRCRKDDFWVLDVPSVLPTRNMSVALGRRGSTANIWRRLEFSGYKPYARSFHGACTDSAGCYMYVFGGMIDGVIQPGEASGLCFDGDFFVVELGLDMM